MKLRRRDETLQEESKDEEDQEPAGQEAEDRRCRDGSLRERQIRNFLACTMISLAMPMMTITHIARTRR